jgi:Tol biopolymer transport system component
MTTWRVTSAARRTFAGAAVLSFLFAIAAPATAQFGQNKVQHERFKFEVIKTEHFDVYFYPEEAKPAQDVARMAERWYTRISRVLGFGLTGRQPIVLYASHPHFKQTNVIEGLIEEGVGGVTEGLMRRITMPLGATLGETDHVLGHELVHAFQYEILGLGGGALPLWFIEGMAEYISVGPRDVQTAMFLRDAVIQERVPKIKQLDDPRYFPYRFGHAFWAYLGGKYGDDIVGRVLRGVAIEGGPVAGDPLLAIEGETGEKIDVLSEQWREAILAAAAPTLQLASAPADARIIAERTGSGSLNVGPSLSPDGARIAFLSERDRLSIDLFVADAKTGKVTGKLINTAADPHFDSLQFLASAGAWDPDGRQLALATLRNGRPVLAIVDVEKQDVLREIDLRELGEIFQPSWSPDGARIAFSAQVGGVTDLFVYDLNAGALRRLTNDAFADLHPSWSADAQALVFTTDRFTSDPALLTFKGYRLATIRLDRGDITRLDVPLDANLTNPQWAANDTLLFFLSDHGGRKNAYRMNVSTKEVTMLTNVATGTSGITPLSPALSVSKKGDVAAVSVFHDGGYDIAIAPVGTPKPVAAETADAALLPPTSRPESVIAQQLNRPADGLTEKTAVDPESASSGLHLLAIGPQVGLSTTNRFGSYVSGAVSFLFSDTLGNHMVSAGFGVNGGVSDIFTQVQYLNRTSRWNWGLFVERLPFVSGTASQGVTTQNGRPILVDRVEIFRQTDTRAGGTVAYPFSRATRIEFGASAQNVSFASEVQTQTFDLITGQQLSDDTVNLQAPTRLNLYDVSTALVRDTAILGPTSPLRGMRARLEVAPTFGDLDLVNVTVDARKYVMPVRPVTLAGRLMHVGRYGASSGDSRLVPLFLGYPTLIRGYDANSFEARECTPTLTGSCPEFDRLFGTRMVVLNGEARAPLVGLFTGKISYGAVPAEIFGFVDSGLAWTSATLPSRSSNWITSAGAGVRVNMFGFAIAEFNAVRPFDRALKGWMFVFNLRPGF